MTKKQKYISRNSATRKVRQQERSAEAPAGIESHAAFLRWLLPSIVRKGRSSPKHPSDHALCEFVGGRLPSAASSAVGLHLERCRRCREFAEDLRDLVAPVTEAEMTVRAPARIRDMAFVAIVRDVADRTTRAFDRKGIEIVTDLTTVPRFFKKKLLKCGLTPQSYIVRILEIFAEVLPIGATIRLDFETKNNAFVVRVARSPRKVLIYETQICSRYRSHNRTVDSKAFLLLHPLWTTHKVGFCPVSSRLPIKMFREIARNITLKNLVRLNELFGKRPSLHWKRQSRNSLVKFLHFAQESIADPPEGVVLSPPDKICGAVRIFSGADFIEQFHVASGTKVPEVSNLLTTLLEQEKALRQAQPGQLDDKFLPDLSPPA